MNAELKFLEDLIFQQKDILPKRTNPFYIVAPPYVRISAGVKVLYSLCHYLNMLGEDAYVYPYPVEHHADANWPFFCRFPNRDLYDHRMNIKILTKEVVDRHFREGLTPIGILPEVYDNIFNFPFVTRYILNYPGLLAPKYTQPHDHMISYSKRLADFVGSPDVLHIPCVDLEYFYNSGGEREGSCYYAGKYKNIYGKGKLEIPEGCTEILRSDKMSIDEVRNLFWKCEFFYCFEDTMLATEAALCGCTVIFVPNEHFSGGTISSHELKGAGMAWGNNPEEIKRAKSSLPQIKAIIEGLYQAAPTSIREFANRVKNEVSGRTYKSPVVLPYSFKSVIVGPELYEKDGYPAGFEVPGSIGHPSDTGVSSNTWQQCFTRKVKHAIKYTLAQWLLPPKAKNALKHIWERTTRKG